MLAKRVIINLLFNEGVLFRTKRFVPDYRYSQAHCVAGDADELLIIDVTPGDGDNASLCRLIEGYCRRIEIPCTAGGHVRSWPQAKALLNAGCDKIVVGWKSRNCYEEVAAQVGCQSLVAGIDVKGCTVWTDSGAIDTGRSPQEVAKEARARGAGEILLTSIDRDGSLSGYDLDVLRSVLPSLDCPVVIAGGCGGPHHMAEAFRAGASGAATANIFHQSKTAMRQTKQWLVANYDGTIRPAEAA